MRSFLRSRDVLSPSIYQRLHFDGDNKYKSAFGGFWTVLIYTFMVYYTASKFIQMVQHQKPYMASVTRQIDYKYDDFMKQNIHINDTNLILFMIKDSKQNKVLRPNQYEKYFRFTVYKTLITPPYVTNKQSKQKLTTHKMKICSEQNLTKSQQSLLMPLLMERSLCLDQNDDDLYYTGTFQDAKRNGFRYSNIFVELVRCEGEGCASNQEFDEWLKRIEVRVIMESKEPNFSVDTPDLITKRLVQRVIPTSPAYLHVTQRKNIFEKVKRWYWPFQQEIEFFTYKKQLIQRLDSADFIVRCRIELDDEINESTFEVTSFLDFLGDQAGMIDLCFQIVAFFFSSFLDFSQLVKYLSHIKDKKGESQFGLEANLLSCYIQSESSVSCLFKHQRQKIDTLIKEFETNNHKFTNNLNIDVQIDKLESIQQDIVELRQNIGKIPSLETQQWPISQEQSQLQDKTNQTLIEYEHEEYIPNQTIQKSENCHTFIELQPKRSNPHIDKKGFTSKQKIKKKKKSRN